MSETAAWLPLLAGAVAIGVVWLIHRGVDVRAVLIGAAALLTAVTGQWWSMFNVFQDTLGRGDIIGPICTAMGYAFVLKITGADSAMVDLLMRPLRRTPWLLIPGGILVGVLTNMAITSQTASAAAVGPILIPLMIRAGYAPVLAAATLLIGCSIGGNLFNPGEPDIVAISAATQWNAASVINTVVLPNVLTVVIAGVVLMIGGIGRMGDREMGLNTSSSASDVPISPSPRRPIQHAVLAPLPVLLLLLLQPSLGLFPPLFAIFPDGLHVSTVMVFCTALAIAVTRVNVTAATKEFFAGMGYAFTQVISLIIAASCFIAGLKACGLIKAVTSLFIGHEVLAAGVSPVVTFLLAVLGGSGTAPSVAFSQAVLPPLVAAGDTSAAWLGVVAAIGANVGRTLSPVAAVVIFTATLANVEVKALQRAVAPALLAGLAAVVALSLAKALIP
jgi:DcuC family C4-dicarboxylate transporter